MELSADGQKKPQLQSISHETLLSPTCILCVTFAFVFASAQEMSPTEKHSHYSVKNDGNNTEAACRPMRVICKASGTVGLDSSHLQPGYPESSADAVSDTFRFLPFILPPTQSPCTAAGESC